MKKMWFSAHPVKTSRVGFQNQPGQFHLSPHGKVARPRENRPGQFQDPARTVFLVRDLFESNSVLARVLTCETCELRLGYVFYRDKTTLSYIYRRNMTG